MGNDILIGGVGSDLLLRAGGNETLRGGSGRDRFTLAAATGADTIIDFTLGEDRILLIGGLSFNQRTIAQDLAANPNDTFISLTSARRQK